MKKNVGSRRKKILLFGSIGCLLMTLYCLQKPIMMWVVKRAISSTFSKEGRALTYHKAEVKNGHLVFTKIGLKQGSNLFALSELKVKPTIDFRRCALKMKMSLLDPNLQLTSGGDFQFAHLAKALKPHAGCYLELEAQQGVLEVEGQPFYFSLNSRKDPSTLATFSLFLDPNLIKDPFLVTHLKEVDGELVTELKMQAVQTDQMLKLLRMAGLQFVQHWKGVQGSASLEGKAFLTSAGVIKAGRVEFSLDHVECFHAEDPLVFKTRYLGGSLQLDPLGFPQWRRVVTALSLEKAHLEWKEKFSLTNVSGHVNFDPSGEPSIHLTGLLAQLNSAQWEFAPTSNQRSAEMKNGWSLPSIHSERPTNKTKEKAALPFTFEGKGAQRNDQNHWIDCLLQFAQGQNPSQIFIALGCLRSNEFLLEMEAKQCFGEPLALLQPFFNKPLQVTKGLCEGKARVYFGKGHPTKLEIEQFNAQDCVVSVANGAPFLLEAVTASGLFQDAQGQLDLNVQLPQGERVQATIKCEQSKNEICGLFHGVEETSIQFGFTSPLLFPLNVSDLSDGWLRSDSLGPAFYLPLAKQFDPDLDVQGAFDVFGTFNGKEIELSVQCEDLKMHSPLFSLESPRIGQRDPMLLKTTGRAKIRYSLEKEDFEIELPLRSATFRDTYSGLLLQEFDADVQYTDENGFTSQLQRGSLSLDNKPLLQEMTAQIAGPSLHTFKVIDLKGKIGGTPVNASEVIFANGFSSLKAEIDTVLAIDVEREGRILNVHGTIGPDELQATILCDSDVAHVQELILKGPKGSLRADGDLVLDLTDADLPLSIRAELAFLVKIGVLEFKTMRRAKIAFAPALGLEVSDLMLQSTDVQIAVEQLEILFPKEKLIARGCRFGHLPCIGLYEVEKDNFSLVLRDNKGELVLKGKCEGALLEKVEGTLNGLTCKLRQKTPNKLKGSVEIDTNCWASYLPEQWQKLPKGIFVLNGDFSFAPILNFTGQLSMPAGSATVDISPEIIECNDLTLNDPSGNFVSTKASLRYSADKQKWGYSIPFAQLSQVKLPALPGVSIAKAVVRDLQGVLGELETLEANGSFAFRAAPGAFMKKFNLDPSVGSPVTGEVDYEIQNGKCVIVALRDVFTDKKRSQFSLSKQASASFDFHGNLFLDLLVKGSNPNKGKKFISLSVRGTLNQPTVSMY